MEIMYNGRKFSNDREGHLYVTDKKGVNVKLKLKGKKAFMKFDVNVGSLAISNNPKGIEITGRDSGRKKVLPSQNVNDIIRFVDNPSLTEKELSGDEANLIVSKASSVSENNLRFIIKNILREQENQRYMFFQNLEQIKRECEKLLSMDEEKIESILENGHDWAQDHIATAKESIDQVYDFIINETNGKMVSESEKIKIGSKVKFKVKDVNDEPLYAGKTLTVVDKDGKRWKLKGNGFYTDATSKELEVIKENNTIDEGKKKAGTKLCSRGKSAAKSKFKVYPSAYANGYAVQVCKGKMPGTDGKKRCSPPYC